MKFLLFLLLLNTLLLAIPSALEKKLCSELIDKDNRCENGSTIVLDRYVYLDNDRKLSIFYLASNEPFAWIYQSANIRVPVLFDSQGKWTIAEVDSKYLGIIRRVEEDFAHRLWLVSSYGVESTSCSLMYSRWGGKKWKSINLPRRNSIPSYSEEIEELCFEKMNLIVTFKEIGTNTKEFWRVPYRSIERKKPEWKKIAKQSTKCINPTPPKNRQLIEKKKTSLLKELEGDFMIQVGAFENLASVEIVENKLIRLGKFSFKRKPKFLKGKRYTRLLLNLSYMNQSELLQYLKTLKKSYPKSQTIQNAFVVKIKREYDTEL